LLSSVAELGQQTPIIVVSQTSPFVVIDGYKRVRVLKRLGRDAVRSMQWSVCELDALLLERSLRRGSEDTLDQAWLLVELQQRFGLSVDELSRRFERSKSWVSRRLSLVQALPQVIQDQVRAGVLSAHAAMKYLVPLARANEQAARQLAEAIAPLGVSSRQVGALYQGWQSGTDRTREIILSHPQVYLQAQATLTSTPTSATQRWLQDIGALGGIARRARRALDRGLWSELLGSEREELEHAFHRARAEFDGLCHRFDLEQGHVG